MRYLRAEPCLMKVAHPRVKLTLPTMRSAPRACWSPIPPDRCHTGSKMLSPSFDRWALLLQRERWHRAVVREASLSMVLASITDVCAPSRQHLQVVAVVQEVLNLHRASPSLPYAHRRHARVSTRVKHVAFSYHKKRRKSPSVAGGALQLIDAADVTRDVSTRVDTPPTSEAQTRPLAQLSTPKDRAAVW